MGCQCGGGTSTNSIVKLQWTLNAAARFILKLPQRTKTKTLMEACGWLSVKQKVTYTSVTSEVTLVHIG